MTKIILPGRPVAKPRMTRQDQFIASRTFRPRTDKECKRQQLLWTYFDWVNSLLAESGSRKLIVLTQPTRVIVIAYFPIPTTWSNRKFLDAKGQPHTVKPDGDNVLKAVCDGLVQNDQMIWDKRVVKYWADLNGPRVEVELLC